MKHYTTLSILMLALLMPSLAKAQQSNGLYSFLDATNSARVAALGGHALPFFDSDIQLSAFNPATINSEMNNSLAVSYVDYYSDINFATVQYSHTFDNIGSFTGTVQYHNYGSFNYTSESGEVQDEFTCSDYAATIGWGRELSDNWSIGANLKYAGIQYESYHAGAIAVDVAGLYRTDNDWVLSLTARNIGMQIFNNFEDETNSSLPFKVDFGASKKLEHLPFTFMVLFDDIQKWDKLYDDPLDLEGNYDPLTGENVEDGAFERFAKNTACHLVVGGEMAIGKNMVLRAAYNYGQRHSMSVPQSRALVGFSAGVGFRIKMFEIDYSRSRLSIANSPNYITVSMNLDKF